MEMPPVARVKGTAVKPRAETLMDASTTLVIALRGLRDVLSGIKSKEDREKSMGDLADAVSAVAEIYEGAHGWKAIADNDAKVDKNRVLGNIVMLSDRLTTIVNRAHKEMDRALARAKRLADEKNYNISALDDQELYSYVQNLIASVDVQITDVGRLPAKIAVIYDSTPDIRRVN